MNKSSMPAVAPPRGYVSWLPSSVRSSNTWHTLGLRGTGSHDFSVTDAFVPEAHSFTYQSLKVLRAEPLYGFPAFIGGKFGAVPLGEARAALETTMELARGLYACPCIQGDKFIPRRPLIEESYMQAGVARAEALIGSARSYLYEQTSQVWQQLVSGRLPSPADTGRYTIAYINAYRSCREAVDQLYCLAGAAAVFASSPLDRLPCDMHTMAQHMLAGPERLEMAGRMLLGAEPVGMFI